MSTYQEFCETTSIQGVAQAFRARSTPSKLGWVVIVIGMAVVTTYSVYTVILSFLDSPVVTIVSIIDNDSMTLPEIGVCYTGAIDADRLINEGLSVQAVRQLKIMLQFEFPYNSNPLASQISEKNSASIFGAIHPNLTNFMKAKNLTSFDNFMDYAVYSCSDLINILLNYKDGMLYTKTAADCRNFTERVRHELFGVCHVLPKVYQIWPSASGSWSIMLKVPKKSKFIPDLDFYRGIVLEFGQPYKVMNFGFHNVPTNKSVTVDLQATQYIRIPYRKWRTQSEPLCDTESAYGSPNHCKLQCFMKAVGQACGCGFYGFKDLYNASLPACLPDTDLTCLFKMGEVAYRPCQGECKPPCEEWAYQPSFTYTELDAVEIMGQLNLTSSEGVVHMRIAFHSLRYTKVSEEDPFTLDMAISNVGGMLGLWLGASIFTVLHAVIYLFVFCAEKVPTGNCSTQVVSFAKPTKGASVSVKTKSSEKVKCVL